MTSWKDAIEQFRKERAIAQKRKAVRDVISQNILDQFAKAKTVTEFRQKKEA
jgi:hypothetical protein